MKKWFNALQRSLGYMPVSEHVDEMNDLARCLYMEVKRAQRDAARESVLRVEAEREYASTTSAANRELAAVTARIPVVVK